jgi:hypothetical protein
MFSWLRLLIIQHILHYAIYFVLHKELHMAHKLLTLATVFIVVSILLTNVTPAAALGTLDSATLTCNSLTVVVHGAVDLVDSAVYNVTKDIVLIPIFSQQFAPDINGDVSYTVTFPAQDPTDVLYFDVFEDFTGFIYQAALACGIAPGRAIPDGFVLRTITCDVAVFDSPSGSPVGDNRILNGQTWYINPTPVTVSNNALYPSWTEIFVSGTTNGFIPTKCVAANVFAR